MKCLLRIFQEEMSDRLTNTGNDYVLPKGRKLAWGIFSEIKKKDLVYFNIWKKKKYHWEALRHQTPSTLKEK